MCTLHTPAVDFEATQLGRFVYNLPVLADQIEKHASGGPENAIIDGQGSHSWQELDRLAREHAAQLDRLSQPSLVVLLTPQSGSAFAMLAALDRRGIGCIVVSSIYGRARAEECFQEFEASHLLELTSGGTIEVRAAPNPRPTDAKGGVLLLTSGTTSRPKCVRHSWRTLAGAVKHRPDFRGKRWLLLYPLSHFAGLQVALQSIVNRGTLVMPPDQTPDHVMRALGAHEIDYLSCTPTLLRQLLLLSSPEELQALKLGHVTLGGEIADQPTLDLVRSSLPRTRITHTYASTEAGAVLSVSDGRAGFDVQLLHQGNLKIDDGQLLVRRTPRAMLGYLGDRPRDDEWLATGDRVEIVGDRVMFLGRDGDVINVGGFKVSPALVEGVVRHVPGVAEVCVVGHRSSLAGNLVKALVQLRAGADRTLVEREIRRLCAERLPQAMVPRLVEFQDTLAKTATHKLRHTP